MYCFRYACTGLRRLRRAFCMFLHSFERFLAECSKQNKRTPSPPSCEDNSRQKLPDSSATSCFIALNKLYHYIEPVLALQAFFKFFFRHFRLFSVLLSIRFKPFRAGVFYTVSGVSLWPFFALIFRLHPVRIGRFSAFPFRQK